jgi:hypothetical protein
VNRPDDRDESEKDIARREKRRQRVRRARRPFARCYLR